MNLATLLRIAPGRRYRAALIGAGQFGHSFVFQGERNAFLEVSVVCDRDPVRAIDAYRAAGVPVDSIVACESAGAARDALARGVRVVLADSAPLAELGLDIVVEATGDPEIAASNAAAALDAGCHVAMVSKEADCTVGPALARRAAARGLVYTPVDGDQPSLLIGLIEWARLIGLEIVAAGKSCEYDFVFDARRGVVVSNGVEARAPRLAACWALDGPIGAIVAERWAAVTGLVRQTVPDLAELTVVANATGLRPDTPALHAPLLRTPEVPSALCPREHGGLLERSGVLEVFCALRAPDEVSFAGGVFVVVRCADEVSWRVLRDKGIPVAGNGRHALLYNPQHLLGIEALVSVIAACAAGVSSAGEAPRPVCDVAARAVAPLAAGTRLALGERHALPGVAPLMLDAAPARGANPVPYYLAAGATLARDVRAGAILSCDDLAPAERTVAWALRREQDAAFFGNPEAN
jgi:predicted homoserine dehydrogenase-like protein